MNIVQTLKQLVKTEYADVYNLVESIAKTYGWKNSLKARNSEAISDYLFEISEKFPELRPAFFFSRPFSIHGVKWDVQLFFNTKTKEVYFVINLFNRRLTVGDSIKVVHLPSNSLVPAHLTYLFAELVPIFQAQCREETKRLLQKATA